MTYKKKLIEVAIPLAAISAESSAQKTMGAAPHPQNLHRWWARRPLAATRAVLWASLVDDPSADPDRFPTPEAQLTERNRLFSILERLVPWAASNDEGVLAAARAEIIRSCDGDLPTILDPFAGGGAIPLEAARLGLPTRSGDLNPVAVMIQRAMLEIPNRFAGFAPVNPIAHSTQVVWERARGLGADVEAYGSWMQEEAARRIGDLYPVPKVSGAAQVSPLAWIWARTVRSPDPAWPGHVPLVRSWTLAKKAGRPAVWVEPEIDRASQTITFKVRTGGKPPDGNVSRQGASCIATGSAIPFSYIRDEAAAGRMGQQLMAVVVEADGDRRYISPTESDSVQVEVDRESTVRGQLQGKATVNVGNYGITEWADLYTDRQLCALTTFSDLLKDVALQVEQDAIRAGLKDDGERLRDGANGAKAYSDAVVTYLAFAVDKCADFWSSICSWNAPNSQIRFTFSRQAIPMTWDFVEANPFSGKMASWDSMLGGVARAIPELPVGHDAHVAQRDARARIQEVGRCVVSTDPPYYDNISYADLADYFYVWMRRSLGEVWPDECATLLTPKADELIASPQRAGSKRAAQAHFENGMLAVFTEAARVADSRFPATIFYAFKATESTDDGVTSTGWETFLAGLLDAGYSVTATWPVRTEFSTRMVASGANALASSIVLACRPREVSAPLATRGELIGALRSEMESAVRLLQTENIAPVDLAQSAIGPGIAIFSRYAKVIEADGKPMTVRTALGIINEVLAEILSGEESEFDADTRFALTWFEQYGHNPAPFGEADLLARAKDTTVSGVASAGVVHSRDGKVRLVERAELPTEWNPAEDSRLTVWETTQHLLRRLDSSEADAADLLAQLGPGLGERSRQLAYLLYGICDRKKWVDEASAYNMLVTAWPEISRLAAAGTNRDAARTLF
jgi:putative DNA methylase